MSFCEAWPSSPSSFGPFSSFASLEWAERIDALLAPADIPSKSQDVPMHDLDRSRQ